MKQYAAKAKLTDLAALLVFGVFTLCVLLVLLTGADVYGRLVARGQDDYTHRTATAYIATRVRQADRAGSVAVEEFGGAEALILREQISGKTYLTRVYCYDGWLRELFTAEGGAFSPEDGQQLLEVEALSFSLEKGLLNARISFPDGTEQDLTLHLRSGEEAAP